MIIDIHGHVSAPPELYPFKASLLASRGSHGRGGVRLSDERIEHCSMRGACSATVIWTSSRNTVPTSSYCRPGRSR